MKLYFLSTKDSGSSIYEYKIFPFIQFFKEWQSPISCAKNEYIYDLRSNNSSLAILILNQNKNETHLELRSPTTFEQHWVLYITAAYAMHRIRCCPLLFDQWLVTDAMNSRLIHIDADGTLIKEDMYDPSPRHIVQLNKHLIGISTKKTFNLHQFHLLFKNVH